MPRTLKTEITEAAIKRHAADLDIRELTDPRLPLRLRYSKDRQSASWHLVRYTQGKAIWRKAGSWPALTAKAIKEALPRLLAQAAVDPQARATVGTYEVINDLLVWFEGRVVLDRNLSSDRKGNVLSAIRKHLRPRLGGLALIDCTREHLDKELIWPLQARLALSTVRQHWATLKTITARACALGLIDSDPLVGIKFSDFISAPIRAKAMRIRPEAIPALLEQLAARFDQAPAEVMLVALQLAHGTRINETRLTKWSAISGGLGLWNWHLPEAHTKTRQVLNLPLTEQLQALLQRYHDLQRRHGYDGQWLFPGQRRGQPLSKRAALEVFARYSAGEWSSHDLRKLARTTWMDLGVDHLVGELLLNHKLKDLNAAYIHTHAEERKRDALMRWHAWLDERGFTALHAKTLPRPAESVALAQAPAVAA